MKRFFGLMPRNCVTISKKFKDMNGLRLTIEAGPEGWTIIWADGSINYRDIDGTPEVNFNEAYKFAVDSVGSLLSEVK